MTHKYWSETSNSGIGWVPSADGHVSFSLMGQMTRPACYRYSAVDHEHSSQSRYVFTFQERTNKDIPWIVRFLDRGRRHHWLLRAQSLPARYSVSTAADVHDMQGVLSGTIDIIPYHTELEPKYAVQSAIVDFKRLLASGQRNKPLKVKAALDARILQLREKGALIISVEFSLFRNGELHVWLHDEVAETLQKQEIYSGDVEDDQFIKEMTPSESVLRQAFYFVKDIAHHHSHHDGASDQIVPLHIKRSPIDRFQQLSENEMRWQRETLWGLSRTVEEMVRAGSRRTLRNALGVICFAESFQNTLAGRVRYIQNPDKFEIDKNFSHYDFRSLRESIRIDLDRISWSLAIKIAMITATFAVFIAAISAQNSVVKSGDLWPVSVQSWIKVRPFAVPTMLATGLAISFLRIFSHEGIIKRFSAALNAWYLFISAHVKWSLEGYRWRKKRSISVILTIILFNIPSVVAVFVICWAFANF